MALFADRPIAPRRAMRALRCSGATGRVRRSGEAQVVREAFTLFLERRQMASVGRLLSERGLLPRSSRRPGVRGERWTDDLVGRVLRNPIYAGFIRCDHHLVPGEHAALIAVETYLLRSTPIHGDIAQ
jgi:Recombinase